MRRIIVVPAVFIGCLIVIWVGTVAASKMPSQELLAPTQTAISAAQIAASQTEAAEPDESNRGCTLSSHYPYEILQWCDLIQTAAQETGLPANLIAAVMLQESGGASDVISSSGAVGLLQVMPRDGIAADFMCINGPCFASRPTTEELLDPAYNIQFGSQMLAGLASTHGSYREALFRYGPSDIGYYYADLVLKIWENYG
ncbi:MAG: transglycosylase SLT domain-containing protein [Anaerolineaceae bacterium]|nr:transglycosylase SLT domain-containing protein [Anaerolineaceae bacterium]